MVVHLDWRDGSMAKFIGWSYRRPRTTWQLTNICNSSSRGPDTLTLTYMQAKHQCTLNTYINTKALNLKNQGPYKGCLNRKHVIRALLPHPIAT